jgi:hypothetical protein
MFLVHILIECVMTIIWLVVGATYYLAYDVTA